MWQWSYGYRIFQFLWSTADTTTPVDQKIEKNYMNLHEFMSDPNQHFCNFSFTSQQALSALYQKHQKYGHQYIFSK